MPFSDQAWSRVSGLRASIHAHPFNQGVAAGTLDLARFRTYVVQDALYLRAFTRALAYAAARAERSDDVTFLTLRAQESVGAEEALHRTLFERFGIDATAASAAEPSPACAHYRDFLLRLAGTEPYEVLLSGLLPCFWVYWEVGCAIREVASPGNPFQPWIETYAGEEYKAVVEGAIRITDRAAAEASGAVRERMFTTFIEATRLEWRFWEAAWRHDEWPVG